ncbi:hypothetical protein BS50DRAFT_623982 [Corynespora cassiicola Philippines]|uniref:F-box domain-containing protein n=1 Tax=Corynespora cassiicola Philippines TaxID=1448308 RepID=A0A2T2NCK7_CORCC|nr:hypothetical protein BS50DRAFT_623982 [Corynespora cassiicola Philippines]
MDDSLPSYESVIEQNPWELIAHYLPSDDLCSAALVCQKWHEIFTPRLWGNPASHFGVENDTVYVALTRFKRTLYWARLYVRELTHTLHLPPAHAEIYGGPHAEWLRDCLERLPRLQCLIVNGLPFFDHASLLTMRHQSLWAQSFRPNVYPIYGLRLLDASGCKNATSTGLAEALPHFPDLVSLDLSKTYAAKDESVFDKLRYLRNLRILKLKGLGLKDTDFAIIAASITTRVRSLDVSDNNLTDASMRTLVDRCLKEKLYQAHETRAPLPPVSDSRPNAELDIFGTEDLDSHLRNKLTQGFVGSLAVEDARDIGITHLYASRNPITVEAVSGLLRSGRLQVLDVGTLPTAFERPRDPYAEGPEEDILLPGVEKLTPTLAEFASEKLTFLRINYKVITEDAPFEATSSPRAELEGDGAVYIAANAHELEAVEPPLPELDPTEAAIFELPGDSVQPKELSDTSQSSGTNTRMDSPHSMQPPSIEVTSEPQVKRGPAYAPEPVTSERILSPVSPLLDASGGLSPIMSPVTDRSPSPIDDGEGRRASRSRHNSTYFVEDRRARLDIRQSHENRLHPGMIPKLRTLVLTDVPTKTYDRKVIDRLIQFIKDCAEETEIAKLRANHTYMLPPGRSRSIAEREYARSLFALQRIIFEMAPPQVTPKKISTSWRAYPTKSSTEDADSEAFWEAATHDFSFFGDEECGLPNAEPGRPPPLMAMSGLQLAPKRPAPPPRPRQPEPQYQPLLDVVAEVGAFRRDRKAAYAAVSQLGEAEPSVEGHWAGDITVVRKPVNPVGAHVDYYGNRYEAGYLYR